MPRKPKRLVREGEPSQQTDKGLEIPVPTRGRFFKDLRKAIRAEKDTATPEAPSRPDPGTR
jgi:hypothetical protein